MGSRVKCSHLIMPYLKIDDCSLMLPGQPILERVASHSPAQNTAQTTGRMRLCNIGNVLSLQSHICGIVDEFFGEINLSKACLQNCKKV